jgi:hypothetical protein
VLRDRARRRRGGAHRVPGLRARAAAVRDELWDRASEDGRA